MMFSELLQSRATDRVCLARRVENRGWRSTPPAKSVLTEFAIPHQPPV